MVQIYIFVSVGYIIKKDVESIKCGFQLQIFCISQHHYNFTGTGYFYAIFRKLGEETSKLLDNHKI